MIPKPTNVPTPGAYHFDCTFYQVSDPGPSWPSCWICFISSCYSIDATQESGKLGRLLNHSKTSGNCHTKLVDVNNHPYLILAALRDIKSGEELMYDYGDRSKNALEAHPWLKAWCGTTILIHVHVYLNLAALCTSVSHFCVIANKSIPRSEQLPRSCLIMIYFIYLCVTQEE